MISRVIIRVIITLLITYLLSPLPLQVVRTHIVQPFSGPWGCRGVALRSVAISDVKDVTTEVRGEAHKS